MRLEIEAKLKVESLDEVREKLKRFGAQFKSEQHQIDSYFDDDNKSLINSDRCLRLRKQSDGGVEKVFLTYKGPKQKDQFKKRTEVELEITDQGSAGNLLSELGYENILAVEKKREVWRFNQCTISLDEVKLLGSFVEIEGPTDKAIKNVQAKLGLADKSHIGQGYAVLAARVIQQSQQR